MTHAQWDLLIYLLITSLQSKLEVLTGGNKGTMKLELYSGSKLICKIDNDDALFGSLPIDDNMRLHVIDNIISFDQDVDKFELTDTQYEHREDSVRSFLKRNKLGKYNEEEMKQLELKRQEAEKRELERLEKITIGSRCKVTTTGQPTRIGTVMYKGDLEGKKGMFVGVKFDEPLGVNDGSSNGKRYFDCQPKYGSFVLPSAVEIGDFPEEEINFDDEI
jgi:tubulin-folding cofactor B